MNSSFAFQKFAAGVLDLAQNKVFMASNDAALDLYDKTFAAERQDGVLLLDHQMKVETNCMNLHPDPGSLNLS